MVMVQVLDEVLVLQEESLVEELVPLDVVEELELEEEVLLHLI